MGLEPLLDALLEGKEEIADRHVERSRNEMPNFAGVPIEEHRRDSTGAVILLVAMRRAGLDSLPEEARVALLDLGERRAKQGVPLEDMLRSWRMGIEETMGFATEIGPEIGLDEGQVFGFFQQAFDVVDDAMVEIAKGHRIDDVPAETEADRRPAFIRGLMEGTLSADEVRSGCVGFGLDPLDSYAAFRARGHADRGPAELDRLFELTKTTEGRIGLAASLDSELVGMTSGEVPRGDLDLIAVGPRSPVAGLSHSYRIAGGILTAAETFGLAGIQDLSTAGLHAIVLERGELGEALAADLVAPVRTQQAGDEILHTVDTWLAVGMRVEPAAERLFVHPNTVRYRLRRYEELTGTDLGITEEAFRVWWALQRDRGLRR
jgi:PucR C-terminal helix-turn-helix domain